MYTLEVEVRDDFAWYGIPPIATLSPGEDVRGSDQTDPVVRACRENFTPTPSRCSSTTLWCRSG